MNQGPKEAMRVLKRAKDFIKIVIPELPFLPLMLNDSNSEQILKRHVLDNLEKIKELLNKLTAAFIIFEAIDKYDDLLSFNTFGRGWCRRKVALFKYVISDYTFLVYDD